MITRTQFVRKHINSTCQRIESSVKVLVACDQLPETELQPGQDYTVRRIGHEGGTASVHHVYRCGSGGTSCLRRLVKVTVARDYETGCQCRVEREESEEACCCDSGDSSALATKTSQRECESEANATVTRQQRAWKLIDGRCWPQTFTTTKQLGKALTSQSCSSTFDSYPGVKLSPATRETDV